MIFLATAAVILAALSIGYLARARRSPGEEGAGTERANRLAALRERLLAQLRELDLEVNDGNIEAATAQDERARLEAELARVLREIETRPASSPSAARPGRALPIALGVAAFAVATVLYVARERDTLAALERSPDLTASVPGEVPPFVQQMVARLAARLAQQPNDPLGWARLGRAYQVLGQEDRARTAYTRAYRLAPANPEILAAYGGFLLHGNPLDPSPEAVAIYRRLHAVAPQHPAALWVLGLVAYRSGHYARAIARWQVMLTVLPPGSSIEPAVRDALAQARAHLSPPPPPTK